MAYADNVPGTGRSRGRARPRGLPDPDFLEATDEEQIAAMKKLNVEDKDSSFGMSGRQIRCLVNYVELLKQPDWMLYQYHVAFSPQLDSRRARSTIVNSFPELFGKEPVFDGMILYMPHKLDQDVKVLPYLMEGTCETIMMTVKLTNELTADNPQCLTIFNLCNRKAFQLSGFKQMGRHYYNPAASVDIAKHRIEIWPGIISAIRLHEEKLLMCCEMSHKLLRTDSVATFLQQLYTQNGPRFREKAIQILVGTSVLTRYNNKTYRVDDIVWDKHPSDTFDLADGSTMSYRDYYRKQYNKVINDDSQPMLLSRGKRRSAGGANVAQDMFLVPELCSMTGLTDEMRADRRVMQDIAQFTRVNPAGRVKNATNYLHSFQDNSLAMNVFETWGLNLSKNLVDCTCRVLPAEDIIFQSKTVKYDPNTADWSRDCRSVTLCDPLPLTDWLLIFDARDENNAELFFKTIRGMGSACGMSIQDPTVLRLNPNEATAGDFVKCIRDNLDEFPKTKIVVTVVNNDNKTRYDAIKKTCCLDTPVPSQVIKARSMDKNTVSVCSKILLQMNCKLGGSLWRVDIPLKTSIVIGYDAYHDSSNKGMSVGAAVSSMTPAMTKWYSQCALHKEVTQLVQNLRGFVYKGLVQYKETSGSLPDKIFLFRDGVGDGQIPVVYRQELPEIKKAFAQINPNYKPKLAFIIVTKSVTARFFEQTRNSVENPPPGTVCDTVITKPERYDFYLVPQKVNQGTVTPVSYNIIFDETGLKPDHLQRFAYKMCHLYYNWQGTIRVPAPCQYAHKLAFLTGQSLHQPAAKVLADKLYFL